MAQSISIKIAERTYSLKVTSPDQEEVIRKAAEDINRKIALYQEKFPDKGLAKCIPARYADLISLNKAAIEEGMKAVEVL